MREWYYWHVGRHTTKFIPWVARNLPESIKYYVVIHGMVKAADNGNPADVTGMQILDLWGGQRESRHS